MPTVSHAARKSDCRPSWIRASTKTRMVPNLRWKVSPPIRTASLHSAASTLPHGRFSSRRAESWTSRRSRDHAEWFGETNICFFEGLECSDNSACDTAHGQFCSPLVGRCVPHGYDSEGCILAREEVAKLGTGLGTALFDSYVTRTDPQRFHFC